MLWVSRLTELDAVDRRKAFLQDFDRGQVYNAMQRDRRHDMDKETAQKKVSEYSYLVMGIQRT